MTDGPPVRPGRGTARLVGSNVAVQVAVMGTSGLLAVITTRLIISNFGVQAYAQYGLLASMAALVPFADLGMSAAVLNAVSSSSSPRTDDAVRRTLLSALRLLLASAAVLAAVGVGLTWAGAWPSVLGGGLRPGGATAALACVLIFAVTLPLGVGQRVLTGLGRNQVQIGAQALAAPFILLSVVILITIGIDASNSLAVLSYLAGTLVAGLSLFLAARMLRPQVGRALRDVPRVRTRRGLRVMNVAWPMLAQMLALPVALQTDRLLLSHLSSTNELARYNLAAQLFGLVIKSIGAAGIALWPVFAKARASGEVRSPFPLVGGFLAAGLVVTTTLAVLLPWLVPIVSDGQIDLNGWLIGGFIAFAGAQAANYPLGMYMTDVRGLRFQVVPILVMVPVNLGLSWFLISPLGAAGPIVGSAVAVVLCQVTPNFLFVRRDLARRRALVAAGEPS